MIESPLHSSATFSREARGSIAFAALGVLNPLATITFRSSLGRHWSRYQEQRSDTIEQVIGLSRQTSISNGNSSLSIQQILTQRQPSLVGLPDFPTGLARPRTPAFHPVQY
ncbi:hypothetical protein CLAIMM_07770 [Cladophialophora immunda]|nr:hypothetical protein CLAIMM_07770 [Cladophialophora immunda]